MNTYILAALILSPFVLVWLFGELGARVARETETNEHRIRTLRAYTNAMRHKQGSRDDG